MIWFTCKQCGKVQGRPEEAGGSLVFCVCGQANRVPWESTAPEPEKPAEEPRRTKTPRPEAERPRMRWPGWGRRPAARPRDPTRCLNHEETFAPRTCADCGESFCANCVVTLQGQTLCGPCKNFRLHNLMRPPRLSALALIAMLLGLGSSPVAFCMPMFGMEAAQQSEVTGIACTLVGLVMPAVVLVLGFLALREIETKPQVAGRALAMTGAAAGVLGILWCLTVVVILVSRQLFE